MVTYIPAKGQFVNAKQNSTKLNKIVLITVQQCRVLPSCIQYNIDNLVLNSKHITDH